MADTTEKPKIELSPSRVMCSRHGEPFRARWPQGYAIFSLTLMQAVLDKPEVAKAVGGDAGKVGALLDSRPACCRVSRDQLLQAYTLSRIGSIEECAWCGLSKLGSPYGAVIGGIHRRYPHVCFECILGEVAH